MINKPSETAPLNPDISKSNYVELISVDLETSLSVCNDPLRAVKNSVPKLISAAALNVCDAPKKDIPLTDEPITKVDKVKGNYVDRSVRSSVSNLAGTATSILGKDILQSTALAGETLVSYGASSNPYNCQVFCTTPLASRYPDPVAKIDLHFIDASVAIKGAGVGRALMQTHKALLKDKYDFRWALSTVRANPTGPGNGVYGLTFQTLRGFTRFFGRLETQEVNKYAATLLNLINPAPYNSSTTYKDVIFYGANGIHNGNLFPLAVSAIVKYNGFKIDLSGTFPINGSPELNISDNINKNIKNPLKYSVLVESLYDATLDNVTNSFIDSKFNPSAITPIDTVRFRENSNKIICVYADMWPLNVMINDSGNFISPYSPQPGIDVVREAIKCGYKFIFITSNQFFGNNLFYDVLSNSFSDTDVVVISLDGEAALTGEYSDDINNAIRKLTGLSVPAGDRVNFGQIQQVWQTDSILSSDLTKKSLSYININSDTKTVNTDYRDPISYADVSGIMAYDQTFDRCFHIEAKNELQYVLNIIDLKNGTRVKLMDLPFLQNNNLGQETNYPSAVHYDPSTRLLFIGTDSGRLYIVSIERKAYSEIEIKDVELQPKANRAWPIITGLSTGFIQWFRDSDGRAYQLGPNNTIFVGFNEGQLGVNKSRRMRIRAYDYSVDLISNVGGQATLTPKYGNDLISYNMVDPRSFVFVQAPVFRYIKNIYNTHPNARLIDGILSPGLVVCSSRVDYLGVYREGEADTLAINPVAFSDDYKSFKDYYNTFVAFPIPNNYPLFNGDYVASDNLNGYMVYGKLLKQGGKDQFQLFYTKIPSNGVDSDLATPSFFPETTYKLTEYYIGAKPSGIFVRNSILCSNNLRQLENTTFSATNMGGWVFKSANRTLSEIFRDGELVLKPGEYLTKGYQNLPGKIYITVNTSDYKTGAPDSNKNLSGFLNIKTTAGNKFHYLPSRPFVTDPGLPEANWSGSYNPIVLNICGPATYVFDMPNDFTITLNNDYSSISTSQWLGTTFKPEGTGLISIKICRELPAGETSGNIKQVKLNLKYDGIPRSEVNIFSSFVKAVYRDPKNPKNKLTIFRLAESDGRTTALISPNNVPSCTISDTCNYWKQNGNGGIASQSVTNQVILTKLEMDSVSNGLIASTSKFANCVWCIPAGNSKLNVSTGKYEPSSMPDVFSIFFGDFVTSYVVESLEFYILMNRINDISNASSSCEKVSSFCGPDPVDVLRVDLDYINCKELSNSVSVNIPLSDIYKQDANIEQILPTSRWDYIRTSSTGASAGPPLGNAYRGTQAAWYGFKVILDTAYGGGIDQCTTPNAEDISYDATSSDTDSIIPALSFRGVGRMLKECDPKFTISDITSQDTTNEIQNIYIPTAGGGTFDLVFTKNTEKSLATIPYNATPNDVKEALENLGLIGVGSINASEDAENTIAVEFVGKLAATPLPLMSANSRNLIGTYFAYSSRLTAGTRNERQTISNTAASTRAFQITFGDQTTTTIAHDASLNTMRSALESLPNIGNGNIKVSGLAANSDTSYTGPWFIDFIGSLSNTNMPRMSVSNNDYAVFTNWVGGIGINEKQSFTYKANRGSFSLKVFGPGGQAGTTDPIKYNATVSDLKSKILSACSFLTDADIAVGSSREGNVYTWTLEYVGNYASLSVPINNIIPIDIEGDAVTITRVQAGGGKPKKISWKYEDVMAGYYILKFELVDGSTYFTDNIQYNASAADIQDLLNRTSLFDDGDVKVTAVSTGAMGKYEYSMVIKKNLASLKMTAIYGSTLLCDPITFDSVPSEPYDYQPIYCPDQAPKQHGVDGIVCLPYPPEEPLPEADPCCTVDTIPIEINKATYMRVERDLFDPYMKIEDKLATVGSLMAARNFKKSKYKPFYLTVKNNCIDLVEAGFNDPLKTRTTVVLLTEAVIKAMPTAKIIERVVNRYNNNLTFCNVLPSMINNYSKVYPDIMPGKNYDIQ